MRHLQCRAPIAAKEALRNAAVRWRRLPRGREPRRPSRGANRSRAPVQTTEEGRGSAHHTCRHAASKLEKDGTRTAFAHRDMLGKTALGGAPSAAWIVWAIFASLHLIVAASAASTAMSTPGYRLHLRYTDDSALITPDQNDGFWLLPFCAMSYSSSQEKPYTLFAISSSNFADYLSVTHWEGKDSDTRISSYNKLAGYRERTPRMSAKEVKRCERNVSASFKIRPGNWLCAVTTEIRPSISTPTYSANVVLRKFHALPRREFEAYIAREGIRVLIWEMATDLDSDSGLDAHIFELLYTKSLPPLSLRMAKQHASQGVEHLSPIHREHQPAATSPLAELNRDSKEYNPEATTPSDTPNGTCLNFSGSPYGAIGPKVCTRRWSTPSPDASTGSFGTVGQPSRIEEAIPSCCAVESRGQSSLQVCTTSSRDSESSIGSSERDSPESIKEGTPSTEVEEHSAHQGKGPSPIREETTQEAIHQGAKYGEMALSTDLHTSGNCIATYDITTDVIIGLVEKLAKEERLGLAISLLGLLDSSQLSRVKLEIMSLTNTYRVPSSRYSQTSYGGRGSMSGRQGMRGRGGRKWQTTDSAFDSHNS